jgi:hypothetical protein
MKRFLVFPYWLFWIGAGVEIRDFFLVNIAAGNLSQADWDFVSLAGGLATLSWMLVALAGRVVEFSKLRRELRDLRDL